MNNQGKPIGIAKKDMKAGEKFTVLVTKDGLLHSKAINFLEHVNKEDLMKLTK